MDRKEIADSSREFPELREEASLVIADADGTESLTHHYVDDHPEIKAAWEKYIEEKWWPWAAADRKAQSVQKVYTDLFSIYQKQQRLGEQYEVVLGLGMLSWRPADGHEVRRHLIAAQASVTFDAARGVMAVGPAGEGAQAQLEQDMLDPGCRPEPDEQESLEAQLRELGDRLWDQAPVDAILAAWVHSVSPDGDYSDDLSRPERVLADPKVHLAPALILRKRTERSFVAAFEEIIRQLTAGEVIPPAVSRFTAEAEEPDVETDTEEDRTPESGIKDLYFPLESNDEQRRIVDRLRHNDGVLVQGPPGTGKSHTIVNLICHFLATGQRVLVTSHTARALKVLQKYIQEGAKSISALAVVLLGNDRGSLQAMEDSVQGITDRQNHWDAITSGEKIAELELKLDEARREETLALQELRSIRESEVFQHPQKFGYEGTLQAIAVRLSDERETLGWLTDQPDEDRDPPLSSSELQELLTLLADAEVEDWSEQQRNPLRSSEINDILSPDGFDELIERESRAKEAYRSDEELRFRDEYPYLSNAPAKARDPLVAELGSLVAAIEKAKATSRSWASEALSDVLEGRPGKWKELREITKDHLAAAGTQARWADETEVSGLEDRSKRVVWADAIAVLEHLEQGRGWGLGPFQAKVVRRGRYLRDALRVGGRECDSPEVLKQLIAWLDVQDHFRVLGDHWTPVDAADAPSFVALGVDYQERVETIDNVLAAGEQMANARKVVGAIPDLPEPDFQKVSSITRLIETADAVNTQEQLKRDQAVIDQANKILTEVVGGERIDPAGVDLVEAVNNRDAAEYRLAMNRITEHEQVADRLQRRDELEAQLGADAPDLLDEVSSGRDPDTWATRAQQFEASWNWARANAWVTRLADPDAEYQARLRYDGSRDRVRTLLRELASEKAWAHCFERMTEHEREHLVAWSKAVRSIGKGTGKYASIHRANARKHMNECRTAISAWVMPLYRVAESITPGSDLFDVVIVDEASQSGPEALLLNYIAKKLIVVGDDKQISPTYAGINHADVNELRARHIPDLPHADAYGVQQSFFDLAEIRYQGRIRLREHFRCMPEIIQFSNNLCYQSEPLIPLRQHGASRLTPVVSAHYVEDGYLKGVGQQVSNPPEAQAVVDAILLMHGNPEYEGKTFGVISLLGSIQAREIEALLLDQLGPEDMERRQLVCGDAYAFQGDERDIILLSLVSAPSEDRRIGTLADEASKRRFNVAASRARDQLVLFHSATLEDLSPQCLRFELLRYCLNPHVASHEVSGIRVSELQRLASTADRSQVRQPDPFGSWLEVDVFLQIAARGYRVQPQFEIAGYRIDLLVEGLDGRLAVECDGDRWHGPDQYADDTARQRTIERCGLEFWRVRGSVFELDRSAALLELWERLEQLEIYPEGHEPKVEPSEVPVSASPASPIVDSDPSGATERPPKPEVAAPRKETDIMSALRKSVADGKQRRLEEEPTDQDIRRPEEQPIGQDAPQSESGMHLELYTPYSGSDCRDPRRASLDTIAHGLLRIIEVEGPMVVKRAFDIYLRSCGIKRMGRDLKDTMNRGLSRLIRDGSASSEKELKFADSLSSVVRSAGKAPIRLRTRGPRSFVEIPPSEVQAVARRLLEQLGAVIGSEEHRRAVLEIYDLKRLTAQVDARMEAILDGEWPYVEELLRDSSLSPVTDDNSMSRVKNVRQFRG